MRINPLITIHRYLKKVSLSAKSKGLVTIGIILVFSFVIRVVNLENNPNGLYVDETQFGYDAYSIMKTGRDHMGKLLPLYPEGLGSGVNAVYIYSLVPFLRIFDLSVFSLRFVSVLWGLLIVFSTYLLAKDLFNKKVGIISSILVSISPWVFQYSRIGFEEITTPSLVILGVLFIRKALKKRNQHLRNIKRYILIGSLLLGISVYTYATAKMFSPLLFFGLLVIYWDFLKKKQAAACHSSHNIFADDYSCVLFFDIWDRRHEIQSCIYI